ncbi:hypothetical protein COU17_03415 [Candidatus Kaiserbacteria bacterium CG10_big_fil_rev_8_21_14_0_10_49_17]|uniref:Uncharacterized protein n=1 Tax=Candidatus Kaiserbacteria bacterium CG10_big_fil_rev_8_21_14_0_10_49_17 TaxID=1974609 RepID=A0A2M6WDJ5_9BACT|nr:MAG: hypothetical protein COU17_03415 [Candidatus Kaiserbacteria bacterium CG10_big_fil_rev_8_21_14_0_10_49_17]
MKRITLAVAALLALPSFAFAATGLQGVLQTVGTLISSAIPIVLALAVLAFFWGLMKYIFSAGDADKQEEGRNIMIWGIIALFVMVSVWGLVRLLQDTFNISKDSTIDAPTVNIK